ncbi:MAG TPA: hypothetical protein VGI05_04125 [Streptosporangiaceae bacterium]
MGPAAGVPVPPPVPGVKPEQLAEAQWHEWLNAERQVLLQAIVQAASAGFPTHAWQIFTYQGLQVLGQGYWADIRDAGQAVLAAAGAASDHTGLGWAHAVIGQNAALTGADDQGQAHLALALDHFRQAGDLPAKPGRCCIRPVQPRATPPGPRRPPCVSSS